MKRKVFRYIAIVAIVIIVGYNSVFVKSLSQVKASSPALQFDAIQYTHKFWNDVLIPNLNKAIEINVLTQQLKTNPEKTFKTYSHALGISNLRYFLVKGQGKIETIYEDYVTLIIDSDSSSSLITLPTEFIYGNAVRDATGMIDMNEFTNTMDLNKVSEEIDRKIREEIIPTFKAKIKNGKTVQFVGAIELNQKYVNLKDIEVIPVSLTVN